MKQLTPALLLMMLSAGVFSQKTEEFKWNWIDAKPQIKSVLILPVNDGREQNGKVFPGTGKEFQLLLRNKLFERGVKCLLDTGEAPYVVKAEIIEFEDLPGEWSMNRDRLHVMIELTNYESKEVIGVGSFKIHKRGNTWKPQIPSAFFPQAIDEFVKRAF